MIKKAAICGALIALALLPCLGISKAQPPETIYVFVQTFVRNSEGQLVAYLETDTFSYMDTESLNSFLDNEASLGNDPISEINGKKYQLIQREQEISYDKYDQIATHQLVEPSSGKRLVEITHDGYLVTSGDKERTVWTFFRSL